jgi:creatinine amidohydrolase/Fe(II)-dependent formamide hydrolase-like protein
MKNSFAVPKRVNEGSQLTSYTLFELRERLPGSRVVLPVCSLGTPYEEIAKLADFVLPPIFHEAFDGDLKSQLIGQIQKCFPYDGRSHFGWTAGLSSSGDAVPKLEVVELPRQTNPVANPPEVLAFSVDTAVEEHGPHLPLATDTIQSYSVLDELASEVDGFVPGPPVDYGHLTWGLPFGMSVDLTPPLVTRYVNRFTNAVLEWARPDAIYVVDVHGSIVHRRAIVAGLEASNATRWAFRWLHDSLVEFASERGDQHAGGVETALVERVSAGLLDPNWWPGRIAEIEAGEMTLERAVELTGDLDEFFRFADSGQRGSGPPNGIVGKIRNYETLDADLMFDRMMSVAREDVSRLLAGESQANRDAGESPWE